MSNFNTAYDDVFRTLLVDCRELIIPVVNEVFHTNYIGTENVVLHENEIFMRQQDGEEEKIVTDSSFAIISLEGESKRYHLECQSSIDGSMLIRMYEYDSQMALQNSEIMQQTLVVRFPESAVIYLRHNESILDVFEICIHTPNGSISYHVPTLKVQQYDIETIFEKNLLFLIPFYIFTYEKQFSEINDNVEKLEALKREYAMITYRLDRLVRNCVINEYIKKTICEMSERVIAKLAVKYDSIRKEVTSIMGGKVLEYEAKDILRKGKKEAYLELVKDGLLSIEEAAKRADMTLEELQKELQKA
ncbi:MAG: hypothetical protein IJE49_03005 [Agathobacter sp.]|nr:hypothetical protein [Agathobacter sp.]